MDEGTIGLVVLCTVSVIVAVFVHLVLPRFFAASLATAVFSDALFQLAAYFRAGHLDSFFLIAVLTGGALAYAIALLVGIPIAARRYYRRMRNL